MKTLSDGVNYFIYLGIFPTQQAGSGWITTQTKNYNKTN